MVDTASRLCSVALSIVVISASVLAIWVHGGVLTRVKIEALEVQRARTTFSIQASDPGYKHCKALARENRSPSNAPSSKIFEAENSTSFALHDLFEPVPTTRRCDLAIIAAGFHRSGSTLQVRLIEIAARHLDMDVTSFYWNYHLHLLMLEGDIRRKMASTAAHAFLDELKNAKAFQAHIINSLNVRNRTRRIAVVIKSHQFDDNIIQMCERQLVVTIRRQRKDVAKSVVAAGFASTADQFPWDFWTENYNCWKAHGAIEFAYEDVAKLPRWHVLTLAGFMATKLKLSWDAEAIQNMSKAAEVFIGQDANPLIPGRQFG